MSGVTSTYILVQNKRGKETSIILLFQLFEKYPTMFIIFLSPVKISNIAENVSEIEYLFEVCYYQSMLIKHAVYMNLMFP